MSQNTRWKDRNMAAQPARTKGAEVAHPITSAAIMDAFKELVYLVPEGAEDDGSSIIAAVLEATSWEDVNSEDGLPSSKDLLGQRIKVSSVVRKISDQDSATGYYLMCEGEHLDTHKPLRFTAGGAQVTAVLAKAHVMRWLPIVVEFSGSVTKSGNTAVNAKIIAAGGPGIGGA